MWAVLPVAAACCSSERDILKMLVADGRAVADATTRRNTREEFIVDCSTEDCCLFRGSIPLLYYGLLRRVLYHGHEEGHQS